MQRARRSCLSVPASSERFIASAASAGADEVFLDLEDSVAPGAKDAARAQAAAALGSGGRGSDGRGPGGQGSDGRGSDGWGTRTVGVRINDAASRWAYADVLAVALPRLDVIVLPKVRSPRDVIWLDVLLGQVEADRGLPAGRIGIEAQIEDAAGLAAVDDIAACSPRLEALVFGPGDFAASLGMRTLEVGEQPPGYAGDAYHFPLLRILVAARANDLAAIDGPYPRVRDTDGFRRSALGAAALGYDGKWVLHPAQVPVANEVFAPTAAEFARASEILDAYQLATDDQLRGAVLLGDEMIDEASRKMAAAVVARGQAAGLTRPA